MSKATSIMLASVLAMNLSAVAVQPDAAFAATGETIVGPAKVVDGDTIYIGDKKFRLYGVDAPEKGQSCADPLGRPYMCGIVSKDSLTQKVGTQTVSCAIKATDQYGRNVAVCSLVSPFGNQDLNQWLVQNGLAVAYRAYGKEYIPDEEAAKAAKKGIWAGSFEEPAQWRKEEKAGIPHPPLTPGGSPAGAAASLATAMLGAPGSSTPAVAVTNTPAPPVCAGGAQPIKGNINAKGTKIYHLPGGPYYDKVVVEPEKGESYFCNEADAAKAGYRPIAGGPAVEK